MPTLAAIALGSNLGDRRAHIAIAIDAIARLPQTTLIAQSAIHETAPVGHIPQGLYLNAAIAVSTSLRPNELLASLLAIEHSRGRDRSTEQRWGPRTLDLDLLLFGNEVLSNPGLTIPHPRLHERLFVLVPLAEVLPNQPVPGLGRTVTQLLAAARSMPANPTNGLPSR